MIEGKIIYFNDNGRKNTDSVIETVKQRIRRNDIRHIVVASSTGKTALKLIDEIDPNETNIIVVSLHAGYSTGDKITLSDDTKNELEEEGAKVFIGSHSLSGVGRGISNKFNGITPVEIIGNTLKLFGGQGLKVCVEIAIMAADAGLVPTDRDILAMGGSHGGADTAIVLKAAHMNNFFDLRIKEILAKPL